MIPIKQHTTNKILFLCVIIIYCFNIVKCNICATNNNNNDSNEPCFDIQTINYNQYKKAQQSQSIQFDCYVKNKGPYSVVWLFENQLISLDGRVIKPDNNIQLDTDSERKFNLKINNLDSTHKGSYKCQLTTLVAKNLDYVLDVLVPPTISRLPNTDVISVREGESITIQCLTQGNPKPKITWTKKGKLPAHFKIDEAKSTLYLKDMNENYSDLYSCMAINGVGTPVTSEFQIYIKYKPKLKFVEQDNINNSVLYTSIGKKEQIVCVVNGYPTPKISILFNNVPVKAQYLTIDEQKTTERQQYTVTYILTTSTETVGEYACVAENEIGTNRDTITVTTQPSKVIINTETQQSFSDAYLFEWVALSGTPIRQLEIQVFSNDTLVLNQTQKIKQHDQETTDYNNNNDRILYRDFFEVSKLNYNQSYTLNARVRNDYDDSWSTWLMDYTFKTLSTNDDPISKHKPLLHHHRHHNNNNDRKYNKYLQSSSFNQKLEGYQTYSSANTITTNKNKLSLYTILILTAFKFYF